MPEVKMKHDLAVGLYDLLVYLTTNYSLMPSDFQSRFSETACVVLRQSLFNSIDFE